jgi:hypothetical protein
VLPEVLRRSGRVVWVAQFLDEARRQRKRVEADVAEHAAFVRLLITAKQSVAIVTFAEADGKSKLNRKE